MRKIQKVAIIGGGAAGLMAAASLAESPAASKIEIHLFEKNAYLGAKVIISGGGRCNVTTGSSLTGSRHDIDELLKNYPRGAKFLMSAFYKFPPQSVMDWFESHGVPLKIEEDMRVFPKSDNGKDIVGALERTLKINNTKIHLNTNITSIEKIGESSSTACFRLHSRASKVAPGGQTGHDDFDTLVITTGGNAYRHTGSTGDGYAFAKALNHTITKLAPSLSSYVTAEKWPAKISGVSFSKATLSLTAKQHEGMVPYTRTGAFLFTHKGVTGPAVFALSGLAAYDEPSNAHPLHLTINFFPDETNEQFATRFQNLANIHGKKQLVNFLDMFLPKSLAEILLEFARVPKNLSTGQLTKELKTRICKLMSAMELTIVNRTPGDEFVTAGGVPTTEVNTNTMESRIQPNLYFAGEILDIDGFTGGFNLQASWATGRLAGESISKK